MDVSFTKTFDKQFRLLPSKKRSLVRAATVLFVADKMAPMLRNHALKGEWQGYRSISAGGDLRLHFKELDMDRALFVAIGSHSQLYK
jgi:mRNA interferase YafQ